MRAAVRTGLLGLTISFKEDVHYPAQCDPNVVIGPTDVLIKVKSAAINPVDYKLPHASAVAGLDVSGVVERVGSSVTGLHAGDAVFGRAALVLLADYALVSPEEVGIKPEWLLYDQAAALPHGLGWKWDRRCDFRTSLGCSAARSI